MGTGKCLELSDRAWPGFETPESSHIQPLPSWSIYPPPTTTEIELIYMATAASKAYVAASIHIAVMPGQVGRVETAPTKDPKT